jgi:hypothetical protein
MATVFFESGSAKTDGCGNGRVTMMMGDWLVRNQFLDPNNNQDQDTIGKLFSRAVDWWIKSYENMF